MPARLIFSIAETTGVETHPAERVPEPHPYVPATASNTANSLHNSQTSHVSVSEMHEHDLIYMMETQEHGEVPE